MAIGSQQKMELKIVGSEYALPIIFIMHEVGKRTLDTTIHGTLYGTLLLNF